MASLSMTTFYLRAILSTVLINQSCFVVPLSVVNNTDKQNVISFRIAKRRKEGEPPTTYKVVLRYKGDKERGEMLARSIAKDPFHISQEEVEYNRKQKMKKQSEKADVWKDEVVERSSKIIPVTWAQKWFTYFVYEFNYYILSWFRRIMGY